ncbi:MAG: IS4 family transposase [Chlamydiales bacterium]|nr:IS4 family transposase [Chlamydiales bacterium]
MTVTQRYKDFKPKAKFSQKPLTSAAQNTLKNLTNVINKKTVGELARKSKLVQRISSKIVGFDFLTCMLLASLDAEHATLEKISDIFFNTSYRIKITPQSLMERLNGEAAPRFFKMVFEKVLQAQLNSYVSEISPRLLKHFTKILLQDSSSMDLNEKLSSFFKGSGGRASKATVKVDVIYDFKAKRYEQIKLTDHGEADQKLALNIYDFVSQDTLIIRDLGYLRMDCVMKLNEMGAFFLSRFKNNTCVYLNINDTDELDFAEYLHRNHRYTNVVDVKLYITKSKVPVRLIAYKVPTEISAERRRQAHATAKKQGRTLTQKSLSLLDFSIFITNVPEKIWSAGVVGTIYRLRWQIELLYKSWKSHLKVDYLKGENPNRIISLIYARMIVVIITNEIYKLMDYVGSSIGKVVSMHKVYNWIRCPSRLLRILNGKLGWWEERYLSDWVTLCMSKQKRKSRKTSLQAIEESDFYYQEVS